MTRSNILLTGSIGLLGGMLLTAVCVWITVQGLITPPLSRPVYVWGLFLFLLTFSVFEIPVMLFAIRRMAASLNPRSKIVVMLTNIAYVFFASAYAAPFILLAGGTTIALIAGAGLAGLCIVRFLSLIQWIPVKNEK